MKRKTIIYPTRPKHRYLKVKPMPTIIVGLKCVNGVVIASDSQAEFSRGVDVKRLNANKIYTIDGRYIIAGSGVLTHIQTLVENVQFYLMSKENQQRSELNKDEAEKVAEEALWALVKHYNIDRANLLGLSERTEYFTPIAVFAGRSEGESIEYYIFFLHSYDGTIEPVHDYGAAGSGAAYAELLLKGLYYENIAVEDAVKVAAYVIDEVKAIDPHCGGDTQVAILVTETSEGASQQKTQLRVLPKSEIESIVNAVKPKLDIVRTKLIMKILQGNVDENKIREITGSS